MTSSYDMNPFTMRSIFLVIATVLLQITTAFGHGCFVCTASNDHKRQEQLEDFKTLFPGINIRKCNEFHRSIRDEFILECPKEHFSCLTIWEENSITRKCAKPPITDCQTANNITYCYCKTDACNNPDRKLDDPAPEQLLVSPYNQKTSKKKGKQPLTEKLISIGAEFSDDEDIRVVNKNKRIVHHSGRPENDDEDEDGSGDEYYEELYYSESDESYPSDYSDTTDRTDTDLIIEETQYDNNIGDTLLNRGRVDNSKIDEINFDDEYEGRNKGIKYSDDKETKFGGKAKVPKTSGAEFLLAKSKTFLFISTCTVMLLLSFH